MLLSPQELSSTPSQTVVHDNWLYQEASPGSASGPQAPAPTTYGDWSGSCSFATGVEGALSDLKPLPQHVMNPLPTEKHCEGQSVAQPDRGGRTPSQVSSYIGTRFIIRRY